MNVLRKKLMMVRNGQAYPRYFLQMLYQGSPQFYLPTHGNSGLIRYTQARFSTSESIDRHSNYYWEEEEPQKMDPQISKFTHKSNAQELISAMPVVEVEGDIARCTGVNEFGYGHPVEYIALNTRNRHAPNVCKW